MEEDVARALAYQVKRELAERYFGFRRMIEEDTANYFRMIGEIRHRFEGNLARKLSRIYTLLVDDDLIQRFARIVGLKKPYFLDRYLSLSPDEKKALFKGLKPVGFTAKGRFKRLLLDAYESLFHLVEEYQEAFKELSVEAEVINEEIKQFKKKFDLSEIMQFLKSFEMTPEASLGHPDFRESVTTLEKKLEMGKVPPPEEYLPQITPLPSAGEIHGELMELAQEAWRRHKDRAKELVESARSDQ